MLPYSKIFKQAFALVKTRKFLWGLGLFLVWDALSNTAGYHIAEKNIKWQDSYVTDQPYSITLGALVLVIILLILYFRAKAGTIIAVNKILEKKEINFGKSLKEGGIFYNRLMGVWFITTSVLLICVVFLTIPVSYLVSINYLTRATILGIFAFLIFVPISLTISLINCLAPIFIVQNNLKIGSSIKLSFDLIKKQWMTLLIFSVMLGLINMISVVILYRLVYDLVGFWPFIGLFLLVQSFVAAFSQAAWVLAFNELVKPIKVEETEPQPVPEIAS